MNYHHNCTHFFEDQTIIIKANETSLDLRLKEPGRYQPCFSLTLPEDYFSIDHDFYIFIAANTGEKIPNEHLIHQIRFIDTKHLHDSEWVDTYEDMEPFHGKQEDMVR